MNKTDSFKGVLCQLHEEKKTTVNYAQFWAV